MFGVNAAIKVIDKSEFSVSDAGIVALQGILIVFCVLVILMIVLYIMKLFSKEEPKKAVSAPAAAGQVSAAPAVDENETIAAVCAAVGAMSGDDPTKRMRVVSITDQTSGKILWKK